MKNRSFWLAQIEAAWDRRSVLWLSGVRRVGKTTLCQSLPHVEYFDCELPRIRTMMEDPQAFLANFSGKRIVLDEIHRLDNPSEILKIAADHYPKVRIIATGSSALGASAKFKDTLVGRKTELWLTPIVTPDLSEFGNTTLSHRLLHGGLPPFFLSAEPPERDFQEWMDAYWAKDIQELFRLERHHSFQKFMELLLANSGSIFEATRYARLCEVSRTTITNYLAVLETTFVSHIIRPFSTRRSTEIISAPKVYGFDTGFVCYYRGWYTLRREDMGILWEHFVLNELHAHLQSKRILYWRDKQGHEVDFILAERNQPPIAIECKWSLPNADHSGLKAFRKQYPIGESFVVVNHLDHSFSKQIGEGIVRFVNLQGLIEAVSQRPVL